MLQFQRSSEAAESWEAAAAFWEDLVVRVGLDCLEPLIGLTRELGATPFIGSLYAGISLTSLTIQNHTGYGPDKPFVSIFLTPEGSFHVKSWNAVASLRDERYCSQSDVITVVTDMAAALFHKP